MELKNKTVMNKERFNQIIDEVYHNYEQTHQREPFIFLEEMNLSRDGFIKTATNNYSFGFMFGIRLVEEFLTFNEKKEIAKETMSNINVFLKNQNKEEWLKKFKELNIPNKTITLTYNKEVIQIYE